LGHPTTWLHKLFSEKDTLLLLVYTPWESIFLSLCADMFPMGKKARILWKFMSKF